MEPDNHDVSKVILTKASVLFAEQGIKAISMNTIARECRISKKTIYKHFETKQLLVQTIVINAFIENTKLFERIVAIENVYDSINHIFKSIEEIYTIVTPVFIAEAKNSLNDVYSLIKDFELVRIKKHLKETIRIGQSQGIFHHAADHDFSIGMYFNFLHNLNDFNEDMNLKESIRFVNNWVFFSWLNPTGMQGRLSSHF